MNIQRLLMQICHREILCLDFIIPNFTYFPPPIMAIIAAEVLFI